MSVPVDSSPVTSTREQIPGLCASVGIWGFLRRVGKYRRMQNVRKKGKMREFGGDRYSPPPFQEKRESREKMLS